MNERIDTGDWRWQHTCGCEHIIQSQSEWGMQLRWTLHWALCSKARALGR